MYTVWTLNRATDLIDGKEDDLESFLGRNDILSRLLKRKKMQIRFGTRNNHEINVNGVQSQSSQLMLDIDNGTKAEYFVPIPLKCIGNLYDSKSTTKANKTMLKEIAEKYHYFPNSTNGNSLQSFTRFWEPRPNGIQMFTKDTKGYYEILRETAPNILIGYSQGGLVARYLAFLDEQVFKENLIHAVITISAPLYGSPLANPKNQNEIIKGMIEFLTTLLTFPETRFRLTVPCLYNQVTYHGILKLLDSLIIDLRENHEKEHLRRTLESTRKWLGGLSDDIDNAFSDLNIDTMQDSFSVLNLVNKYELQRIFHGAIQSANNDLTPFVECCLTGIIGFLAKPFVINRHKSDFDAAGKTYKTKVMKENSFRPDPVVEQKIGDYVHGMQALNILNFAHDFIIPTVYQVMSSKNNVFVGNCINQNASHISGSDRKFGPGATNYRFIKQLLGKIADLS